MDGFRDFDGVEFEVARRGYDREQVDAHLAEVHAEIARLQAVIRGAGESQDGSYPEPVQHELDRVSAEVDAIIDAARQAAEGLRTRAASEASRWRDEADADARRWRSEAEEESTRLRQDAETSSQRTLDEAQEEADRRRSDADSYAARVREEADAYAQQTRQAAESAASQVKEESDAYAAGTRASADKDAAELRQDAEAHAARVTSSADGYASDTRESADAYAAQTRSTADEEARRTTAEAEAVAAEARQAAHSYAAALRESADTETARQRADAKEAADTARASVWEQSTAILESVAHEVAEVRERADTEALAIIADGERQSHRLVSRARQSSEEQRRGARIEAERLVGDAQAQHDEIIETANRAAAAAQERAQALERRREELMGQLEKAQEAMRTLEEELETRRGLRDRDLPADTSTVKIVSPPEPEELAGVRVIPSASRVPPTPVSAEEIMDEVISLRQQREQDDAAGSEAETLDEPDTTDPESELEAPTGDIDSLFANLREADPPRPSPRAEAAPRPDPAVDPDELRERLTLPLQNRAHREVKRQLTEQQNVALEQLRVSGADWQPDPGQHQQALGAAIGELVAESARAGYLAARELGVRSDDPPSVIETNTRPGEQFAADLVAAVGEALEESRAAGETTRKTSGAVSRVYRAWRTDRAEPRLREMSDVAYADALRVALRAEGVDDTEWALGEWGTTRHAS